MTNKFDIIVIGGGPGGYVAAIRAAQLGLKVALAEEKHLGGICLNWGCIPTKALLRSSEIYTQIKHAEEYGLSVKGVDFDLQKIVARSRTVSKQLNQGIGHLLKKNKVTVFDARATLAGGGKVKLSTGEEISAKNIILATGASARQLPNLPVDGEKVINYKEALTPKTMPKELLVIGSGAIGIEFASFYNAFDVKVTVVEVMDRILPVEDKEISKMAKKSLAAQGIKILLKTAVKELKKGKNITVIFDNGEAQEFDRVIIAIGVSGNSENLGLENTKVKVEKSFIKTNEWSETDEKGIFAIGDVAGTPCLAHKASHEGVICVEKIAGEKGLYPLDKAKIAGCTYCHPQIASVGMTEQAAKDAKRKVKIGRFPFTGNGKAIALGESEGLVKTIFDEKTGELLGAHMIGAEVTELIQGFVVAMGLETTEAELIHTIFPHPTLSEMMHESVLDAYGKAIHI